MKHNKMYCQNCLETMSAMSDNSVDSIVTDPPYGLKFMGKKWDCEVPGVEIWKECLRVLKPGGHLLAFAGTRTQHRMAVNIEDAGFEIRDMIAWVYGQGFPKSFNIGNSFCNCGSSHPENHYLYDHEDRNDGEISREQKGEHGLRSMQEPDLSEAEYTYEKSGEVLHEGMQEQGSYGPMLREESEESAETRNEPGMEGRGDSVQEKGELYGSNIYEGSGLDQVNGKEGRVYNGTQGGDGSNVRQAVEPNGGSKSQRPQSKQQRAGQSGVIPGQRKSQKGGMGENCNRCGKPIAEKDYTGFGTALKPSFEPITVARKPIPGTVANNVLQYGTGGINIDGCRVAGEGVPAFVNGVDRERQRSSFDTGGSNRTGEVDHKGRFPANFIHDGSEEVAALFPHTKSGSKKVTHNNSVDENGHKISSVYGKYNPLPQDIQGSEGSAARFFYTAKASKSERGRGNDHPTVKPLDLMRYLVRLVTPPKGLVYDPFAGSGTTLIAAIQEGFSAIGSDLDQHHCNIFNLRTRHGIEVKMF